LILTLRNLEFEAVDLSGGPEYAADAQVPRLPALENLVAERFQHALRPVVVGKW
jgi:hypothetical protein